MSAARVYFTFFGLFVALGAVGVLSQSLGENFRSVEVALAASFLGSSVLFVAAWNLKATRGGLLSHFQTWSLRDRLFKIAMFGLFAAGTIWWATSEPERATKYYLAAMAGLYLTAAANFGWLCLKFKMRGIAND